MSIASFRGLLNPLVVWRHAGRDNEHGADQLAHRGQGGLARLVMIVRWSAAQAEEVGGFLRRRPNQFRDQ
jgi:hypothetical protein